MNKFNFLVKVLVCFIVSVGILCTQSTTGETKEPDTKLLELCNQFNVLNSGIRDNKINISDAKKQFSKLLEDVRKDYYAAGGLDYPVSDWVFPLHGYGYKSIGGVHGNGYQKGGYNYFDGNRHSGHPSQDIFIRDKKQTSLDDVTRKPVDVLSVSGGIVVALEKKWDDSKSLLRGGKYIWIYDPTSNALLYYAHNSSLHVDIGAFVKPGDVIAKVGRTGLNAYKRRSPSHLHLTYLAIVNGLPVPRNIFKELSGSKLM